MPFRFESLRIPEVILVEAKVFEDRRGLFMEAYKCSEFQRHGIVGGFVQDNYIRSVKGVLRGLHYQKPPRAQGKLVRVVQGDIFDVAVDIRTASPTYGQWVGVVLSARSYQALYIPEGFAHGYCVLTEEAHVLYKVTAEYAPELERGIIWNDPAIGINWPVSSPILGDRDARLPRLRKAEHDFEYKDCS